MKKFLAAIVAMMLVLSLVSCDDKKDKKNKEETSETSNDSNDKSEAKSTPNNKKPGESSAKDDAKKSTASTKLMRFYEDLLLDENVTAIMKSNMMGNEVVLTYVRSGDMYYSESKNGPIVMKQIVRDDTQYIIYPGNQIVSVPLKGMPIKPEVINEAEKEYYEKASTSGTTEYNGKSYYYEEFEVAGATARYLFEGDDLKYIIENMAGMELVCEMSVSSKVDSSLFEVPEGNIQELDLGSGQVPDIDIGQFPDFSGSMIGGKHGNN